MPGWADAGYPVIVGNHIGSGAPVGVYSAMVAFPAVYITWPLGSMSILPQYKSVGGVGADGTLPIALFVLSYSKKNVDVGSVAGFVIGPAVNSTSPFGSTTAGASTAPSAWFP